ncbi:TonB-dependent receptor plug domain-containing protein [Massilia sp. TSP1-1-2]|uniref:TonB-dependent receptor plug domain-containing protein n=2 Tax=unclassified Massilia TaxID=2609279 RepID=UPI003CF183AE
MRLNRALQPCLAMLLILQAFSASAQATDEEELALVYGDTSNVTIATGSEQSLRRAPAVASVVTAQDIAAMGATDLDHILETIAGIHISRSPNQYSPLYMVRGIYSAYLSQVLVLQNGIPVTSAYLNNKGNVWGGYPVEHIARIEVLRGPGSALYGSDAFAGVINIITKGPADTRGTEVGMRVGSFATRDAWVQHGGKLGPASVAVYLRAGRTHGFRSIIDADAQSRNDAIFGTRASLAGGPVNVGNDAIDGNLDISVDKWRFRAGYKGRDNVGTGAGIANALDPVGKSKSERVTGDLSWTDANLGEGWSAGAMLAGMTYKQTTPVDYQLFPPGLRFPTGLFPNGMLGGPDFSERQLRASAFAAYAGWRGHNVRGGIGHDDLNLYDTHETRNFNYTAGGVPVPLSQTIDFSSTNPFLFPQRRQVDYAYVQDEWTFAPDWTVTAGVRHDHYSDFGGTTNPRGALVWDASYNLTVKLMYGRAFRAPAFIESYGVANPVIRGNPNLKPETNHTLEAAISWQVRADTQLNLTIYRYAMSNIIRTVPNATPNTGATYRNTGDQDGNGMELESQIKVGKDLRVTGNYSWQRSIDKATGQNAGYAPRHHAYGRADWQFARAYLVSAQLNVVRGRARAPGDVRKPVADYATLDLTLHSERGRGKWDVTAALRNALNADVREPSPAPGLQLPHDLPMAPRALSLQGSYWM